MELTFNDGKNLPIMESFYTLQGEGFHSGRAAYFIRLSGNSGHNTLKVIKE